LSDKVLGILSDQAGSSLEYSPIIAVAGRGQFYVERLITRSKGDTIVNYRSGNKAIVSGITDVLEKAGANEVKYAFDAVNKHHSYQNLSQVLQR
jgi:NADPH2:quinone reductase